MQYENAKDILPASLLEEVQKYAEGKVIYIPKSSKTKGWGVLSGYREKLNKRNSSICSRFAAGASILELAEEFYLSPETVKKIVYGKRVVLPEYSPSVYSAQQYSNAGLGEEWVRVYLASQKVEMPDASEFFLSELVRIPLRLIEENALNEEDALIEETALINEGASAAPLDGKDFPDLPLIVLFEQRRFHVLCQKEYLRFLRGEKKNAHYAFVFAKNEEYGYYLNNFGKQFQR